MTDQVDGAGMSIATSKVDKLKVYLGDRYKIYYPPHNETHSPIEECETLKTVDSDDWYDMKTFPRGRLLIINMKEFTYKSGLKKYPRVGTDKDAESLTSLFIELGFIVELYEDLSIKEVMKVMTYTSKEHFSCMSTLFVAFLTHGQEKLLYATDGSIEIRKITSLFTGSNLAGKPKIFLIQACQGSDYMESYDQLDGGYDQIDGDKNQNKITFPVESDFLYAYSTAHGFYSWRNGKLGSWFIQTLCEVFRKHADKMDIVKMLTRVNHIISLRSSKSKDPKYNAKRQVSSTVSQLRKELYLFPPKCLVQDTSN